MMFIGQLAVRLGTAVFAALTAFALAALPANAADKVLVSAPPLHSLVSSLLEGVDTPGLLYSREADLHQRQVTFGEIARIQAAELVIWVGREYEAALDTFHGLDRSIALKGLTLAKTIPLHAIPDPLIADRPTAQHDMRFWLDPKLAMMAVRQITPALVRVYPDQADRILDNEIALVARIRQLAGSMRKALGSEPGVPLHYAQSDVLYLARRFNLKVSNCPAAAALSEGFLDTPGGAHYFTMMLGLTEELRNCQTRTASAM